MQSISFHTECQGWSINSRKLDWKKVKYWVNNKISDVKSIFLIFWVMLGFVISCFLLRCLPQICLCVQICQFLIGVGKWQREKRSQDLTRGGGVRALSLEVPARKLFCWLPKIVITCGLERGLDPPIFLLLLDFHKSSIMYMLAPYPCWITLKGSFRYEDNI